MNGVAIERFDHVQINVTDLARAKRFYGGILGLTEVPRPASFDFEGAWYRIGEVDLHLVVRAPEPESEAHVCFWVADVHGAARTLEALGQPVAWQERLKIPGVDRFFVRDPDGNRIEVQGADGTGQSRWD